MPENTRSDFISEWYTKRTGSFRKVIFLVVKGTVYIEEPDHMRSQVTQERENEQFS